MRPVFTGPINTTAGTSIGHIIYHRDLNVGDVMEVVRVSTSPYVGIGDLHAFLNKIPSLNYDDPRNHIFIEGDRGVLQWGDNGNIVSEPLPQYQTFLNPLPLRRRGTSGPKLINATGISLNRGEEDHTQIYIKQPEFGSGFWTTIQELRIWLNDLPTTYGVEDDEDDFIILLDEKFKCESS